MLTQIGSGFLSRAFQLAMEAEAVLQLLPPEVRQTLQAVAVFNEAQLQASRALAEQLQRPTQLTQPTQPAAAALSPSDLRHKIQGGGAAAAAKKAAVAAGATSPATGSGQKKKSQKVFDNSPVPLPAA